MISRWVLSTAGIICSSFAIADIAPYLGTRCSDAEDIHIEVDGIGFNEHTICDWTNGPTLKPRSMHGMIECRNVYVLDVSTDPITTEIQELGTRHLRLARINDIDIDVYLDRVPIGRFGACG